MQQTGKSKTCVWRWQEGVGKKVGSSRKRKLGLLEAAVGNRCSDLQHPMSPAGDQRICRFSCER